MRKTALFVQLGLFLLCVVLLNIGVQRAARNSVARQVARQAETAPAGSTLFLGNSLVEAGIDTTVFPPDWKAVNGGMGSSTPVEHFLLWREAAPTKPRRVVYGFFDTLLSDPARGGWDELVGNRALSYHANPKLAQELYAGSAPLLPLIARVPILVERKLIWSKVELLRRRVGGLGLPVVAENQFGRVADFAQLEQNAADFRRKLATKPGLSEPLLRLIDEATAEGVEVVFVLMPLPRAHRTQFYSSPEWRTYLESVDVALKARHARLIDASDWIEDPSFSDVLHLNREGARQFCQRLVAADAAQGQSGVRP